MAVFTGRNSMKKDDDHYASLYLDALRSAFGREWYLLGPPRARIAVLAGFTDASDSEGLTANEYRRRIGAGNLQAYADCLPAGKK
jgi:hypothetical protein